MPVLSRRPRAILLVSALGLALFCVSAAPLGATPLTLAAERHLPRAIPTVSPLLSSLTTVLLVLGTLATAIAALHRPRLASQRPDSAVTPARTATVPPNTGCRWGVGN